MFLPGSHVGSEPLRGVCMEPRVGLPPQERAGRQDLLGRWQRKVAKMSVCLNGVLFSWVPTERRLEAVKAEMTSVSSLLL